MGGLDLLSLPRGDPGGGLGVEGVCGPFWSFLGVGLGVEGKKDPKLPGRGSKAATPEIPFLTVLLKPLARPFSRPNAPFPSCCPSCPAAPLPGLGRIPPPLPLCSSSNWKLSP